MIQTLERIEAPSADPVFELAILVSQLWLKQSVKASKLILELAIIASLLRLEQAVLASQLMLELATNMCQHVMVNHNALYRLAAGVAGARSRAPES